MPKPKLPPRAEFSAQEQAAAQVAGIPDARFFADSDHDYRRALPRGDAPWLSISDGGADGAYGAGVLAGWSEAGTRPQFAAVIGTSAGALTAPFAFLGKDYDGLLREVFTTTNATDVFEIATTPESLLDTWPLKRLVDRFITPELLQQIAHEHARGRRLFVVTVNLDTERPVVWNLGAIAAHGGDDGLALFRDVLMASSSIPGLFPPVLIEAKTSDGKIIQEMHSDGGIAGAFYLAPESYMRGDDDMPLPMREVYLLVNGKLAPQFAMAGRNTLSVLGRAIAVASKISTRAEIAIARDAAEKSGTQLNLAFVNASFSKPARGAFDTEYMRALFDLGFNEARNGRAFHQEPTAPFSGATPSTTTGSAAKPD